MLPPLILALLCGIQFDAQEIPGLRVGETDPLSGNTEQHFFRVDANADGVIDLLLPSRVVFQRNGRFDDTGAVPLPVLHHRAKCDVYENMLFFRLPGRLEAFTWRAEGWKTLVSQSIRWPDALSRPPDDGRDTATATGAVQLERFLHDFNEDGIPEIVVPAPAGLYIYAKTDERYREVQKLAIYPDSRAIHLADIEIWPPEKRALLFPPREKRFSLSLAGHAITIATRRAAGEQSVDYEIIEYRIDKTNNFALNPAIPRVRKFENIPNYLQPCRLNEDDTPDFAGGELAYSQAAALPNPLYDTVASTDGGATLQRVRTNSFPPKTSFQDFDGDGDADMIVEASGTLKGGMRESLNRFMFERTIDHEVRVHFQNALGEFSPQPDRRFTLNIKLEKPPYHFKKQYARYLSGETIDITGDFDADGYKDLVVRDRPDRLSIYFSRSDLSERRARAVLPIATAQRFGVADVDGDGKSDIVIQRDGMQGAAPESETTVHFARTRQ